MKYDKIIKWGFVALFLVGLVLSFYGFAVKFPSNDYAAVDTILYGTYAYVGIALVAVLFGILVVGGINNPKSLLKILVALVVIVVLVGGTWMLTTGTPVEGLSASSKVPNEFQLKLTDTVLYLTYLSCGAAILTLLATWVINAVRK